MTWEQNIHASMFCNAWQYLLKTGLCSGVDAVIKAYKLYLEQCPQQEQGPLLALTRAWTLVRFVESGMLELSRCNCCDGNFITHAHQPAGSFACSLCQPPSRAVKRRKLSRDAADIIPQLLDEQIEHAV
ncbi:flagellar transcriptional activator FlhC [Enterobacter hormaechei]|nr:flagellar transcriptional activator FlhC [Enterobacter hormaechei]